MPVRIFTVPFDQDKEFFQDEELRAFMTARNARLVNPQFFQCGSKAYWTVFVEYDSEAAPPEGEPGQDLTEEQRRIFERLKEWRREKAEKQGVPMFIVATNKQLREVAAKTPSSLEALRDIKGFGVKKIKRHGREILDILGHMAPDKKIGPVKADEESSK